MIGIVGRKRSLISSSALKCFVPSLLKEQFFL